MCPLRGYDVTRDVTKPFPYIYHTIFAPGTKDKGRWNYAALKVNTKLPRMQGGHVSQPLWFCD